MLSLRKIKVIISVTILFGTLFLPDFLPVYTGLFVIYKYGLPLNFFTIRTINEYPLLIGKVFNNNYGISVNPLILVLDFFAIYWIIGLILNIKTFHKFYFKHTLN